MDSIRDWASEHRRQLMVIFVVLAVVVLLIGLGLSWFVHNKSLSTVGMLQTPSDIKLMGPTRPRWRKSICRMTPRRT